MKKILAYMGPYKWPAIIALAFMLVELAVELIQPLIIGKIVDEGIMKGDMTYVVTWGSIMMGLGLLAFAAGITNSFFSAHAAQSFAYDLRIALFKKVQSLSMPNFLKFPTSALITRLTNDVTQVQQVFFMSMRFMLRAPLVVIGSLILVFFVNVELALYLVAPVPFLLLFLWYMVKKGGQSFERVQRTIDRVNRVIQENLQATRLIKAYMRGLYESSRFVKIAQKLRDNTSRALQLMEIVQPILLVVMNAALLIIIWFGAEQIQARSMPVGDLVAVINYALRITGNFSMFSFIIVLFARAKASADRMEEVLAIEQATTATTLNPTKENDAEVTFERVNFSYVEGKEILKDIDFTLRPREQIAIMGATGSGKSTLLQLIPRLYDATAGQVTVEGVPIAQWPVAALREKIGFVPQRSLLFTGTIFDNIVWGKKDATLEEVEEACKKAQIHDAIMAFDDGYQTRVGQKGVNLSGGQKQRIAIARALIRKPAILLFDDSMSALDIQTEEKLWAALQKEQATMIVVTQKVHTAQATDRVFLMDDGKIVASGTHDELSKTSPLYAAIIESQQEASAHV
ncbi:ABC transporter ATP-binding protein [Kurthia sp. 3B1D]|uniref:ABC transporter ATP-binding protein n=1 Tax=Candidatus Kurthia intestinigallinarum TaxID=1562256 RepID=A0A433RUB2_9BACL|nr:ABC transporter ATP-binding protein [Kurthia sp. 3B1D]RUS55748.1 ABC transporter ATP-binding protein [Kurthia sp. 3B1D]